MKTAIITGTYGVIGREITKGIANSVSNIILIGRDRKKLIELQDEILRLHSKIEVAQYSVDLSNRSEIFSLASRLNHRIDILVNNAATAPRSRMQNKDGIEMQWATNVLGYFSMIRAFEDHLKDSPDGRIVNVASYWAGGLDLNDPEFKRRTYNNDQAYRQSKQTNRMISYGFAKKYDGLVNVNTCHPGDANSKLSSDLGFGGIESARKAAETPVYLATSEDVTDISGNYFVSCQIAHCQFKSDSNGIDRLMSLCDSY